MRSGILICLCLGLSTVASAEWKEGLTVPGEPRDVKAWSPGTVAIAHSTGVELHVNEEQVANRNLSPAVGTLYLRPSGCFAGVNNDGDIFAHNNCIPPGPIFPVPPTATTLEFRRVMQTASGITYAAVAVDTNDFLLLHATAAQTGIFPWTTRVLETSAFSATSVMGVTESAGGLAHALVSVTGPPNLLYVRGDKSEASFNMNSALTAQPLQTVDLIPTSGVYPIALVGNGDGLFRAPLSASPAPGDFRRVTLLDGGPVSIVSVDVTTELSTGLGTGFGLAVGTRNGEHVVLGAVPTGSASDSGTTWRIHPAFANSSLPVSDPFDQVSCVDSTFCVITLRNQGRNVIYYLNAEAPVFGAIPAPVLIDERTTRTLEVTASDADGDAVRVSADVGATPLTVNATPGVDALSLSLTAPEVCETTTTQFTVFASDGLGTNDRQAMVTVRIENTEGPEAPGVLPLQGTTTAGGSPLVFSASPGAGLCESVDYVWSEPPGQPLLVTDAQGRSATFNPPEFVCSATGARYTYEVWARDRGQKPSAPTAFSVEVRPWGKPAAPFALNAVRQVTTGNTVVLSPESLHACAATVGLPRVETVWRLQGGAVPPGLTVKDAAGNPVDFTAPVTASALQVSASNCDVTSLTLVARNRMTVDEVVVDGPEASVRVEARPEAEDVSAASLDLTMKVTGAQDVEATLGTSLRCPSVYKLKARMFLESADGVRLASQVVPVPGAWRFQLPAVCSATTYTVRGELFSDAGTPVEAGRARQTLTAEARAVALGEVDGEALVARCGEGAKATLTQRIPPDACTDANVSWSQEGGPALTQDELSGLVVTVATRETGLQELVGTSVTLRVTADAGGGNAATRVHSVPIVAEPFVDVTHSTESASGQETGLVGVVVELSNTTDCAVTGLRYVERVEGMELVPGSVKVEGATLAEQSVEGGFQVEGVALAAHTTSTLTYVGRPRLLSSPRFAGEVFLNGVPVSGAVSREPPSSCGCSQGSSGAALLGLLAVAQWLRRRRDGARR
ncbi:hypothetical protein ACN469_13415 [Corallococcus terminator]